MIKTKNIFDQIESDDGGRVWVESIGLTKDLQEWCEVAFVAPYIGPPKWLAEWFTDHPERYLSFRSLYHNWLSQGPFRAALEQLAIESRSANITLLHADDNPDQNASTALRDFIARLESPCPPEHA